MSEQTLEVKSGPALAFWTNSSQRTYSDDRWLEMLIADPSVVKVYFRSVKLRLSDNSFYTPDFMVIHTDGSVEFHGTQEDSKIRLKMAAATHHWAIFKFVNVKNRRGGSVIVEEIV